MHLPKIGSFLRQRPTNTSSPETHFRKSHEMPSPSFQLQDQGSARGCAKNRKKQETGFLEFLPRFNKTIAFSNQRSRVSQKERALEIAAAEIVSKEGGPSGRNRRRAFFLFPFPLILMVRELSRNAKETAGISRFCGRHFSHCWRDDTWDGFGGGMESRSVRLTENGWLFCSVLRPRERTPSSFHPIPSHPIPRRVQQSAPRTPHGRTISELIEVGSLLL